MLSISEKRSAEEEAAKCKRIKAEADANMRAAKAEIEAARSGQKFVIQSDISLKGSPLFVFSINGLKQNARSLLTPVSDPDFYALSHGSLHFGLYGS